MQDQDKWIIRPYHKDDSAFMYSTWLNSYHYDSWARTTSKTVFFTQYKQVIDNILTRSMFTVAALKDDPEVILGYLISEPGIVHYLFVKEAFRKFGIATSLVKAVLQEDRFIITHKTQRAKLAIKNKEHITYNPFLLFAKSVKEN